MKVKPTATIILQQDEQESVSRLRERRLDPHTGKFYNYKLIKMNDPHLGDIIAEGLRSGDKTKLESIGMADVNKDILEVLALNLSDAKAVDLSVINRFMTVQEDHPEVVSKRWKNF